MCSVLPDYAEVFFILSQMTSGMQRQAALVTHGMDTIIWSLLEEKSRQRVGREHILPQRPLSERWVAKPGRADLAVQRAPPEGPHSHSTLHTYQESRKGLGTSWQLFNRGSFLARECHIRRGEKPELGKSAGGVHMLFQLC